ncbi:MAG: hypothetical protein ACREAX_01890 [Candidatus Nitrosotenuis sp.]
MLSDDQIKAIILHKLHKRGNWGASHTAFDNIPKGFKDEDLGKHGAKRVEKLGKELIRQGLIITKPTHYGFQVSLNPRVSDVIIEFMKRFFPEV